MFFLCVFLNKLVLWVAMINFLNMIPLLSVCIYLTSLSLSLSLSLVHPSSSP